MDKSWQKNLLAFLGLTAAILAVAAYFFPFGKGAKIETPADLEARLQSERKTILEFVAARTQNAEIKLDAIANSLQDLKMETRDGIKKLDDRLYELQREKVTRGYGMEPDGG